MADSAAGGRLTTPAAKASHRRRAAGIYGAIITAAILDAAGGTIPTDALVVAVVATLTCTDLYRGCSQGYLAG